MFFFGRERESIVRNSSLPSERTASRTRVSEDTMAPEREFYYFSKEPTQWAGCIERKNWMNISGAGPSRPFWWDAFVTSTKPPHSSITFLKSIPLYQGSKRDWQPRSDYLILSEDAFVGGLPRTKVSPSNLHLSVFRLWLSSLLWTWVLTTELTPSHYKKKNRQFYK